MASEQWRATCWCSKHGCYHTTSWGSRLVAEGTARAWRLSPDVLSEIRVERRAALEGKEER